MKCVLFEFVIDGIFLMILFYLCVLDNDVFLLGDFNIKFLE